MARPSPVLRPLEQESWQVGRRRRVNPQANRGELCQIMGRQKLKAANCDLRITNTQTKEEYTDDNTLIPKNSSVIVRRVLVRGVKTTSKTRFITRTKPVSGTSKAVCKNTISHFFSTHCT
ncbi:E3 ubiquitin-protein ligase RBBP6-like [Strix aluco]|uniref:E3 ubiquitin-protein ligase RBBP6-like n=1 Tax=Strix aluco TaxID=111821 RepID=UPI003DA490A0